MSQKDYEYMAASIAARGEDFKSNTAMARFAHAMGRELRWRNPRFDMSKWMNACMPSWVVGTKHANIWERIVREDAERQASTR